MESFHLYDSHHEALKVDDICIPPQCVIYFDQLEINTGT